TFVARTAREGALLFKARPIRIDLGPLHILLRLAPVTSGDTVNAGTNWHPKLWLLKEIIR
ncbi:MAG TPA: hypothetical protein VK137_19065, partial [Planctomycetaceae bacterium]|nr:hypothetical protein [Planctomycetaceae bacterium]